MPTDHDLTHLQPWIDGVLGFFNLLLKRLEFGRCGTARYKANHPTKQRKRWRSRTKEVKPIPPQPHPNLTIHHRHQR
ncbi:hypothetical protein, partial [Pseudomonas sp. R5(2017)]|uniref:hypothetical protein n=1 Tax=Pseudomonas sp. R5(2017) TaxID=1981675 RepID=UPI001C45E124